MDILPHVAPETLPPMPLMQAQLDLAKWRIRLAESRLRSHLTIEVMRAGTMPTPAQLDAMIASIPADKYAELIAERT